MPKVKLLSFLAALKYTVLGDEAAIEIETLPTFEVGPAVSFDQFTPPFVDL